MGQRLIDANALKEEVNHNYLVMKNTRVIEIGWLNEYVIDCMPTIEPEITEKQAIDKLHETGWLISHDKEMTERLQGEWIKWNFKTFGAMGDWEYKCSNCERVYGGEYNFCPNCGADMGGGAE